MTVAAVIAENNVKWGDFMRAGDAKGLAGLYAKDCKVLPPGYQTVYGRDAMEKVIATLIASGCTGAKLFTDEIDPSAETSPVGTIFWERGHYVFYKEGDAIMETGKFFQIWRKLEGGKLELYSDVWNNPGPDEN